MASIFPPRGMRPSHSTREPAPTWRDRSNLSLGLGVGAGLDSSDFDMRSEPPHEAVTAAGLPVLGYLQSSSQPAPRPSEPLRPWRGASQPLADGTGDASPTVPELSPPRLPEISALNREPPWTFGALLAQHGARANMSATAAPPSSARASPPRGHSRAEPVDSQSSGDTSGESRLEAAPADLLAPSMCAVLVVTRDLVPAHGREVPVRRGEPFVVYGDCGEWWDGANEAGQRGLVPKSCCNEPAAAGPPAQSVTRAVTAARAAARAAPALAATPSAAPQPTRHSSDSLDDIDACNEALRLDLTSRAKGAKSEPAEKAAPAAGASTAAPRSASTAPASGSRRAGGRERAIALLGSALVSTPVSLFLGALALYTLLIDDCFGAAGARRSDAHDIATTVMLAFKSCALALFAVTWVLDLLCRPAYRASAFPVLDALVVLSLVPDFVQLCGFDLMVAFTGDARAETGRAVHAAAFGWRVVHSVRVAKVVEAFARWRHGRTVAALAAQGAVPASGVRQGGLSALGARVFLPLSSVLLAAIIAVYAASVLLAASPRSRDVGTAAAWTLSTALDHAPANVSSLALRRTVQAMTGSDEPSVLAVRHNGALVYGSMAAVWRHYETHLGVAASPANTTQVYLLARHSARVQAGCNIAVYVLLVLVALALIIGVDVIVRALVAATRTEAADAFRAAQLASMGKSIAARFAGDASGAGK